MWHFLIVEDIATTREQLQKYLREIFPEAQVDLACTVSQAEEAILHARRPYDCIILDFKLPKDKGLNPEEDLSICDLVRSRMPGSFIAHVSAYFDNDRLKEHIRIHHSRPLPPHVELAKDAGWTARLGATLKNHAIERGLHRLGVATAARGCASGDSEGDFECCGDGAAASLAGPEDACDLTTDVNLLCYDIEAYWPDLDEPLKERIRRWFRVEEDEDGTVRVGLI